jgi:hypothetical protein
MLIMNEKGASVFNLAGMDVQDQYFYYNQVERLLDQSADLFERGLKDAAQADELDARKTEFKTNRQEFEAINAIELAEQSDGKYKHDADATSNEAAAQASLLDGYTKRAQSLQQASDDIRNNRTNWIQKVTEVLWRTLAFSQDDELYNSQRIVTGYELQLSQDNADAALAAGISERDAAAKRSVAANGNSSWAQKNAAYQVQRWTAHASSEVAKINASQEAENGLNYEVRETWLIGRSARDFRDAMDRLKAAKLGMSQIYGYDDTDQWARVQAILPARMVTRQNIEDCLRWVRDAIAFLVRFGHRDQACVRAISVRTLAGDHWDAGLAAGEWQFQIAEEKYFPRHRYVRLRGISARIVPKQETPKGVWNIELSLPLNGYCRIAEDEARHPLSQSFAPPVVLGRVDVRNSQMPPDVGGVSAWYNLSPFSADPDAGQAPNTWKLRLDATSTASEKATDCISDILLDFSVALQFPVR